MSLQDATRAYREGLAGGERVEFAVTPLDRTEVPCWTAARFSPGEPTAMGWGFAATDEAAIASALGETIETHQAAQVIPTLPRRTGAYRDLAAAGAVDPVSLILPAGTDYGPERELHWVPARDWRSGDERWLPVEAVASVPDELGPGAPEPLFTPITNGLGAGETLERAVLHGLLELIQRDGNTVAQRALDRGVRVDVGDLDDPVLRHLTDELGIDLLVKAADAEFGMANVYVVGCERDPEQAPFPLCVTGSGEAAHPDRGRAIRKAVLEYCSSRVRKPFCFEPFEAIEPVTPERYLRWARGVDPSKDEPRALRALLEWMSLSATELRERIADPVLSVRETVALDALPHHDVGEDPAEVLPWVLDRLAGFEVLWVDLSPAEGGARVVKVIVLGLEMESASYGRVGPRALAKLLERDPELVGLGAPPPGAAPLLLPAGHEPAWLHRERLQARVRDLYALYREPSRHASSVLMAQRAAQAARS